MLQKDQGSIQEMLATYVLGGLSMEESLAIEARAAQDAEFRKLLDKHRRSLEIEVKKISVPPSATVFGKLMQRIDAIEQARPSNQPPIIHSQTKPAAFSPWVDAHLPEMRASQDDFKCIPIGSTDDTQTFLVKVGTGIPQEVHTAEVERILILEGECDFLLGDQRKACQAGSQVTIPLHLPHEGWVTSANPCYFIVQRSVSSPF